MFFSKPRTDRCGCDRKPERPLIVNAPTPDPALASTVWTITESPAAVEARIAEQRVRLDVVGLAVRIHESGVQDDHATVRETAERLYEFVEGDQ